MVDGAIVNEYDIQKKLESITHGKPRRCLSGVVDIVSESQIIEIKVWSRWREAIGQILSYGMFYPDKKKRIHFFGVKPDEDKLAHIKNVCASVNIAVSFE